ncbi:MAG: hypothetical protein ACRDGN_00305, partial [bacterium]
GRLVAVALQRGVDAGPRSRAGALALNQYDSRYRTAHRKAVNAEGVLTTMRAGHGRRRPH